MEKFRVNVNNVSPKRSKYSKWYAIIASVLWLALGTMGLLSDDKKTPYYLFLFLGFLNVLIVLTTRKVSNKYHITFDDKGIETQTTLFKKFNTTWENIKSIKVTVLQIELLLKNGSKEDIDLSYLEFMDVKEIKEKIFQFAEEKNVSIS